jgi:hypothetical protein
MKPQSPVATDQQSARRAAARRTALIVAGVSVMVYVGFILLNVVAR